MKKESKTSMTIKEKVKTLAIVGAKLSNTEHDKYTIGSHTNEYKQFKPSGEQYVHSYNFSVSFTKKVSVKEKSQPNPLVYSGGVSTNLQIYAFQKHGANLDAPLTLLLVDNNFNNYLCSKNQRYGAYVGNQFYTAENELLKNENGKCYLLIDRVNLPAIEAAALRYNWFGLLDKPTTFGAVIDAYNVGNIVEHYQVNFNNSQLNVRFTIEEMKELMEKIKEADDVKSLGQMDDLLDAFVEHIEK